MVTLTSVKPDQLHSAQTLGDLLRNARLQTGVQLEEVALRTYIKLPYLQALEDNGYEQLPAAVYTSGYIRQYAKLLGLDGNELVQRYHQEAYAHQLAQKGVVTAPAVAAVYPLDLQTPQFKGEFTPVVSHSNGRVKIEEIGLPEPEQNTVTEQDMDGDASEDLPPPEPTEEELATQTLAGARQEAQVMRHQAEQYAEHVLVHLEEEIQKTLAVVRNGRTYLKKRLENHDKA